jgi:plasmid rolling circle replication initiator protein Rep
MKNKKNTPRSQEESFFEPLNDFKQNGKKRPWDKNKSYSCAVEKAYLSLPGLEHYGKKIAGCGNWLRMAKCPNLKHGGVLKKASFCRVRGCIVCQWRRSLVVKAQLMDLVKEHRKEYPSDVPLLFTGTIVNVKGEELSPGMDVMTAAWKRLMELKPVKGVVNSWFRSLEITYNEERADYHPHFHALFMVPKNYFYKTRGMYIPRDEWLRMWRESMRDDRITQVDIRTLQCRTDAELQASIGEVAKYMTKPSSYIFENELGKKEVDPKVIETMHYATKGRRLVGFGGYFSKIRKAKKMIDVEKADLINVEGEGIETKCHCKICQQEMVEKIYTWYTSADRYLRKCSVEETKGPMAEDVIVLGEEENLVHEEFVAEAKNEEKLRRKQRNNLSILLEALKKISKNANGNEDLESYGSNGERIQCRGPT